MRGALLVVVLCIFSSASSVAHAQDLGASLDRFAAAWSRGDAEEVAAMSATGGVFIEFEGEPLGPLGHRQATAILKRVLEDRETIGLRPDMARTVTGNRPRAFGELAWTSRAKGTSIPETRRVFLALVREEDGWRVSQIRILR